MRPAPDAPLLAPPSSPRAHGAGGPSRTPGLSARPGERGRDTSRARDENPYSRGGLQQSGVHCDALAVGWCSERSCVTVILPGIGLEKTDQKKSAVIRSPYKVSWVIRQEPGKCIISAWILSISDPHVNMFDPKRNVTTPRPPSVADASSRAGS